MIKIIITKSSAPCRKAVALLDQLGVAYELINARDAEFDNELFCKMLQANTAEEGIYTFLASRSTQYKNFLDAGVDFDDLNITEILTHLKTTPKLGTYPFIYDDSRSLVSTGYAQDILTSLLVPREERLKARMRLYASTTMDLINEEVDARIAQENTYDEYLEETEHAFA